MSIKFTQFLRPDGRRKTIEIDRPEPIEATARQLVASGVRLEIELLLTGEVSMTAEDEHVDERGSIAHEIVPNGPAVVDAVDRLITTAAKELDAASQKGGTL